MQVIFEDRLTTIIDAAPNQNAKPRKCTAHAWFTPPDCCVYTPATAYKLFQFVYRSRWLEQTHEYEAASALQTGAVC